MKETVACAVAAIPGLSWGGCDVLIGPDGLAQVIEVNSDGRGIGGARYLTSERPNPLTHSWSTNACAPHTSAFHRFYRSPLPLATPEPLLPETAEDTHTCLPALFHSQLRQQGWELEEFSEKETTSRSFSIRSRGVVARVAPQPGTWTLFIVPVQRHAIVRGLLYSGGILRPRGRMVTSENNYTPSFDEVGGEVKLVRVRRPWESGGARVVTSHQDIDTWPEKFRHRWMAQGLPQGTRCWVIASSSKPLAVLADKDFPGELPMPVSSPSRQSAQSRNFGGRRGHRVPSNLHGGSNPTR